MVRDFESILLMVEVTSLLHVALQLITGAPACCKDGTGAEPGKDFFKEDKEYLALGGLALALILLSCQLFTNYCFLV